ncbi:MAG: DEAD/DEAH box helicase [Candidatus Omnitrophota bacterium]
MEIDFLRHFGFSPQHTAALRSAYGSLLLPLQEKAINEGRLFEKESLLVSAPTSSGKTFLAEILFLFHVSQGRNVIYLAPTKALANQRYRQLQERYREMGYEILLSTRDHPFQDRRIVEGRFHLAIVIYEKMRALMAMGDSFLPFLGACVVDEMHYVYHPQRGAELEILLAKLREEKSLQMLGLSAMPPDEKAAEWLKARLVVETARPVELRQGVLFNGRFHYQEFNSRREGTETFPLQPQFDEGRAMIEAAYYFASKGETTLVFWSNRDQCYIAARKLAELCQPEAKLKESELARLEPTAMRRFLSHLLPRRIAVHTSDLTQGERDLVERWAQKGEALIICATSTLAEGVNFPVTNVLTSKRMYGTRPRDIQCGAPPAAIPIARDQLFNMIGRAGRLGCGDLGRGMLVASSEGDVEGLMSMYMRSEPPALQPALRMEDFSQTVLKSLNLNGHSSRRDCVQFLQRTLTGISRLWPEALEAKVDEAVDRLKQDGFVSEEMERLYLSPLGRLVVKNGLSARSAQQLNRYIGDYGAEWIHPVEILTPLCLLDEIQPIPISIPNREILDHLWTRSLWRLLDDKGIAKDSFVRRLTENPSNLRREHHAAFKKTLLMVYWIDGKSIEALEKEFNFYTGAIHRLGEELSWLTGCLAEIAASFAVEPETLRKFYALQERLTYGLPEKGLDWGPLIRRRLLMRQEVLSLLVAGYNSPAAVRDDDLKHLQEFLSKETVQIVAAHKSKPVVREERLSSDYVIELDKGRLDRVKINGTTVALSKLQARLLRRLAANAGECVPYEDILQEMWPDGNGDRKSLFKQKRAIILKAGEALGKKEAKDLIESSKGDGLVLKASIIRN